MKDRTLLMIPGPIEFEPEVMQAMAAPTTSHVAANFIDIFGQALEGVRKVFLCPDGQPFVVAGSGTLAMDLAGRGRRKRVEGWHRPESQDEKRPARGVAHAIRSY